MLRKTLQIILIFVTAVLLAPFAHAYEKNPLYEDFVTWYLRESGREHTPFAATAILDAENMTPLQYHAEEQPIPTASLAKLFAAKALLIYPQDWNQQISFTFDDNEGLLRPLVNPEDIIPLIHLQDGDTISRLQAFAGMLIASANNAPYALARTSAYSLEEFVAVMNAAARDLGMKATTFAEPSGLSLQNRSTAKDLALGGCKVYREDLIRQYAGYSYFSFQTALGEEKIFSHTLHSLRNDLDYSIYTAAKTGYLDETGYHVMAQMKTPAGKEVCVTILGADSRARLDELLQAMRDWLDEMYSS